MAAFGGYDVTGITRELEELLDRLKAGDDMQAEIRADMLSERLVRLITPVREPGSPGRMRYSTLDFGFDHDKTVALSSSVASILSEIRRGSLERALHECQGAHSTWIGGPQQ